MKFITNSVPRELIDGIHLLSREREAFDYIDWDAIEGGTDSAWFFRYRGEVYSLDQFLRFSSPGSHPGWDGYHADSAFSGLLVRYVDDGERVIIGWFSA